MNVEDLKEYLEDYMYEIISVIVLVGSFIFLLLNMYHYPMEKYKKDVESLEKNYYNKELEQLKNQKNREEEKKNRENNETLEINSIPQFLIKINQTCKAPKVIIRTLTPDSVTAGKFELKFIANYFDFLRVLSEFEKLNINILNITVQPYEIDKDNPKHLITLSIVAIGQGEKLTPKDVAFLDEELRKPDKRNPFQRFAKPPKGTVVTAMIDLTYLHKLSGIGKIGDKNIATIDTKQYSNGDTFEDMLVKEVNSDSVLLTKETENGVVKYIIRFRNLTN